MLLGGTHLPERASASGGLRGEAPTSQCEDGKKQRPRPLAGRIAGEKMGFGGASVIEKRSGISPLLQARKAWREQHQGAGILGIPMMVSR